jgi:ligand-binding sensor domain-containing protein/signal transduction histidine kinase
LRSLSTCLEFVKSPQFCLWAFLAGVCFSVPAAALDPSQPLSHYVYRHWGPEQGFPAGTINAISRSSDGYLWLGTDRGLVRFDGYGFDLIQPPIPGLPPIGPVRGLTLDAQGMMWILLDGAHLLLYRDGKFEDAFTRFHISDRTFTSMSLDTTGGILLFGLSTAALQWSNGTLVPIPNTSQVSTTVTSVAQSRDGRIWMGTRDDGLFVLDDGRISSVPALSSSLTINALLPAANGGLWVGTDRGIRSLTADEHLIDNLPPWTHRRQIFSMFRDDDGCVWAGTDEGLLRVTSGNQVTEQRNAKDQGAVGAVFADHEGDLWFGDPGGLERFQDGVFTTYSAAEGFPEGSMGPIFADPEVGVWFAPLSGGLYWYKNGRLRQIVQAGLDRDVVYSIDGGTGEVWVGRQNGGLTRILLKGNALVTRTYTEKQGLAQNSVYAVHRSPDGQVWAGTVSGGVSVLGPSGLKTYSATSGLGSNEVDSITESRDGTVWFATPNGLTQFRGDHWINWTMETGLPSENVRLCFADSQGTVWIETDAGLAYLSGGHITTLHNLPNLLSAQILGIAEDHLGFLWFSTPDHVLRVDRDALLSDSLHVTDIRGYGMSDGLSGIESLRRERSLVADSSGRLWISLSHGIGSGEPMLTMRNSLPIRVRLDSVSANGAGVNIRESRDLPAGTRSITFNFESDSLFAPDQVRFRYRLEGADPDWSDAVGSRQVSYHNLVPRKYSFHVMASREGRLWNSPETVTSFSIDPAYWQTRWFRICISIGALLSILVIFRLRGIQLSRQLNARFQERLAERTRIAQELHDTLLQSFQGLMLRFQTIENMLPGQPIEAKKDLEEVLDRADDALHESRSAIQNIRSSASAASNFPQALNGVMSEMAEECSHQGTQKPEYSVVIEGSPRQLNPSVDADILRIAQESLRNSFQHARASRIETEVTFGDSNLRIRFRDDGVGIDPDILRDGRRLGHWGMIGMKERAARIGAKLDVWSKPGAGTELDLNVPGQIAYGRSKGKNGLRALKERLERRHEHRSSSDPDSHR